MKTRLILCVAGLAATSLAGEIRIVTDHNDSSRATSSFKFANAPSPVKGDAAENGKFALVDGEADGNSGGLAVLNNGRLPSDEDQPAENFFFNAGTSGGRIALDLGEVIEVKEICTFSWHPNSRGPQVYKLYASDGTTDGFVDKPKRDLDPHKSGWTLLASVDTRQSRGESGGQHAVAISRDDGSLGKFRYLLFDCSPTETDDPFGNTFFSEIDVIKSGDNKVEAIAAVAAEPIIKTFEFEDGKYQFSLDTTAAPDLTEWAERKLVPVVQTWYPKIVAMLPSEGYSAPTRVTIIFRDNMGGTPASAGGNRINCNIGWFRRNLEGEAVGSVVHEMVHIVQSYGRARRSNPSATRPPGWLVEGIPDYIRWFLYEPETKGAEITSRNFSRARFDGNYRITANFLNWVVQKYDKDLIPKLNAAARQGNYSPELWKEFTGKTVEELGEEWRELHRVQLGLPAGGN